MNLSVQSLFQISLNFSNATAPPPQTQLFYARSVTMAATGVNRGLNAIKVKDTDQHQQPPSIGPDNESGRAAS